MESQGFGSVQASADRFQMARLIVSTITTLHCIVAIVEVTATY